MNKQGQELTLSTIIVAILVVIVLVLVVTFFLFGFGGLTNKIKEIFFGTTAGVDVNLAVQNCETYCDNAKLLPTDILKKESPYCKMKAKIDTNYDGKADAERSCSDLGVTCSGITCQ